MKFTIAPAAGAGCPDAVVRFLPAGAPVTFSDPSLQRAYAALFQGDGLTAAHKQLRTLRLPLNGGFTTLLLMGFDSGAASPFDDFRAALASLGAALNRLEARQRLGITLTQNLLMVPTKSITAIMGIYHENRHS